MCVLLIGGGHNDSGDRLKGTTAVQQYSAMMCMGRVYILYRYYESWPRDSPIISIFPV